MTIHFTIRDIAPNDFTEWLTLWQGYNAFYERVGPTAVSEEMTKTTWSRFFDHYEPVHCKVAIADHRLVGFVHYIFHRNTTQFGPTCYLQDLFTAAQARGSGIGTELIFAVYEAAKKAGAERVYWHTHESNAPARRVYDKVARNSGFILYRHEV